MALADRSTKFSLVIQQVIKGGSDTTLLPDTIESVLKSITLDYYFILHDSDSDINGELKTPHYHVVIIFPHRTRVSTIINRLAEMLEIPPFAISCETVVNFNYILRYLIHFDNDEKFQYAPFNVVTNNRTKFELAFLTKGDELDFYTLFAMIQQGYNRIDIMRSVGLGNYTKYHKAISDLLYDSSPSIRKKDYDND